MFVVRRVTGNSMLPRFIPGSIVIGVRFWMRLRPNAVVMIRHGGMEKMKRIAEVKDGRIYVLGDNPAASTDSRSFGWLPESSVMAKVVWPR